MKKIKLNGVEKAVLPVGEGSNPWWGTKGPEDEASVVNTLKSALDMGVNLFHTGVHYGGNRSEEWVGNAVKDCRDDVVVWAQTLIYNIEAQQIKDSCKASMEKMQTDYFDIYNLQYANMDYPISKSMEAIESLRSQGKIGAVSVSNFPMQTMELAVKYGKIDIVQVPYSLLWRQHENDMIPFCREHGIDMIATTSLGQGLLGGEVRLDKEYNPGENHMVLVDEYKAEALYMVEKLRAVALELGTTLPKLALKWVLAQPDIKGALVCARTPQEMAEDVAAIDLQLSQDVIDRITTVSDELADILPVFPDLYGNWRGWNKWRPQAE